MEPDLEALGWNGRWAELFSESSTPEAFAGRVVAARDGVYEVVTERGKLNALAAGVMFHKCTSIEMPAVGDWVSLLDKEEDAVVIDAVLERRSVFVRNAAGRKTQAQVIAANIDTVLILMGLDGDFNLRRLERFLVTVVEGGAEPVVVLSKADLGSVDEALAAARAVAPGFRVLALSARYDQGLEQLQPYLRPGRTLTLVGSSGAGKSTLLNGLAGKELAETQEVRYNDSRGRHTTTHRELFPLACGALMVDTPGLRELQLWADESSVERVFSELIEMAAGCRFRDCSHTEEPGCEVQKAIQEDRLAPDRLQSYRALLDEIEETRERQQLAEQRKSRRQLQRKLQKRR